MPCIGGPELLSESSLSSKVALSSDVQLQNPSPEQTYLSSQDNMNDDTNCFHYIIQIDDDGSQKALIINVGFASSVPQARGSSGNGGTTKNKYVTFFSHMNEK